ncbi:MAG TPA: hypothetical protein VF629_20030 [Hymenobacter sp.]|jgi:hypothetical protein|uniref:hypothetical protein n=1 Tax=Hymenobacter sp. TaxID=1898978 RepID=UPI002ED9B29E
MADFPVRPDTDEAWHDLLGQLHRQPKAQPRPFFYGRVQARLAAKTSAEKDLLPAWLRRPAYAALLGALVLSLSGDGPGLRAGSAAAGGPGYQPSRVAPR